ncbi:MAG: hypothetical protein MEEGG_02824 [Eggerthella lenta]
MTVDAAPVGRGKPGHRAKPPIDPRTLDAVLRLLENVKLAVEADRIPRRPPDAAAVHLHFGRRPHRPEVGPRPVVGGRERARRAVARFEQNALVEDAVADDLRQHGVVHLCFPSVQVAHQVGVRVFRRPLVGRRLVPYDVGAVHRIRSRHGDRRARHHDDVMALRRIAAIQVRVEIADAIPHVVAVRERQVDVVFRPHSREVPRAHAGAQPRPDVRVIRDLAREQRGEALARVGVRVDLPRVLRRVHGVLAAGAGALVLDGVRGAPHAQFADIRHVPFLSR